MYVRRGASHVLYICSDDHVRVARHVSCIVGREFEGFDFCGGSNSIICSLCMQLAAAAQVHGRDE